MNHWLDKRTIPVGRGQSVNAFWHCFGAYACHIEYDQVVEMLMASQTALFPLNTHELETRGLVIGNGAVKWENLNRLGLVQTLVPCLNINLRKTAAEAVSVTRRAFAWSGVDLLKLEVLRSDDESIADDAQVAEATVTLAGDGFRVMPLITADPATAAALAPHVQVLRVQGSPIGSGRGIDDPEAIAEICRLGVPVVLDCGIGSAEHIRDAFRLGCQGFLVDWLLFKDGDPVGAIRRLKAELAEFLGDPAMQVRMLDHEACIRDAEDTRAWREYHDQTRAVA